MTARKLSNVVFCKHATFFSQFYFIYFYNSIYWPREPKHVQFSFLPCLVLLQFKRFWYQQLFHIFNVLYISQQHTLDNRVADTANTALMGNSGWQHASLFISPWQQRKCGAGQSAWWKVALPLWFRIEHQVWGNSGLKYKISNRGATGNSGNSGWQHELGEQFLSGEVQVAVADKKLSEPLAHSVHSNRNGNALVSAFFYICMSSIRATYSLPSPK